MKHFIIILFLFSAANGQTKKKLRQQIHDLEIKLVHCQAKNCDTILKCPSKREVKAKTKRLKHAEKTKRTALELESNIIALKQKNKRLELELQSEIQALKAENERLKIRQKPKNNKRNNRKEIKVAKIESELEKSTSVVVLIKDLWKIGNKTLRWVMIGGGILSSGGMLALIAKIPYVGSYLSSFFRREEEE